MPDSYGNRTVAVIGAGAAGLMAAAFLAERGVTVKLIDKNPMPGRKIRITGKGRCNITNIADMRDFFSHIPTNPKFLYSALHSFTNLDLIELLERNGLKTKIERGGRVFPVSDNARDVAETLRKIAFQSNLRYVNDKVTGLITEGGRIAGVKLMSSSMKADSVIIATGGLSYPLTGSTGDGYALAESVGHTVIAPKPSLVPIETFDEWSHALTGLSLKNVGLTVYKKNKKVYSDFGEMLFTHFGVSGPIILSASAHMRDMPKEDYKIVLDMKPALSQTQLDRRLQRDFEKNIRKYLINALDELLPKAMIPVIINLAGVMPRKEVHQITKDERRRLGAVIKSVGMSVKCFRPIDEAIVTSGGVKIGEINPATMESKIVKGLYFAGEVIDVDAYTGGFNLQIAFSTGAAAGRNA